MNGAGGRVEETCREWPAGSSKRCGERAEFIVWGRYFPPDALGPRCADHTRQRIPHMDDFPVDEWAVYDLRNVYTLRDAYRTLWGMTLGHDGQPPAGGTPDDITRLREQAANLSAPDERLNP